jgi:hypothetical protein
LFKKEFKRERRKRMPRISKSFFRTTTQKQGLLFGKFSFIVVVRKVGTFRRKIDG